MTTGIKGFNWRTANDLKLKRITLGVYIHNNPKANVVWFDDVALSSGYIGPLEQSGGEANNSQTIPAGSDSTNIQVDQANSGGNSSGSGGCFISTMHPTM